MKKFQVLSDNTYDKEGVGNIVNEYRHTSEDLREEEKVLKDLDNVINIAKIGLKFCESNPF